jgi:hypothetical protein
MFGKSKWGGERRLPDCQPCAGTDRISMRSGWYAEPFAKFGGGDRNGGGGIRLSYRAYVQESRMVQSAVTFGLFFDFIKL